MKFSGKSLMASLVVLIGLGQASFAIGFETQRTCADPVAKVTRIMNCIEQEKPFCAATGYAWNFKKLHNTVDTKTIVPGPFFWIGTFWAIDFDLDIDHIELVGENEVSLRYVETVTFRDGEEFKQHEHALIKLNGNCRMTLWDQYGDNAEQKAVDDKARELLPF